jgi:hypothetical protein
VVPRKEAQVRPRVFIARGLAVYATLPQEPDVIPRKEAPTSRACSPAVALGRTPDPPVGGYAALATPARVTSLLHNRGRR